MPARKQSAGARKNPLRVVGDPVPVVGPGSLPVAAVPPLRTAYTPREMRQMMISEFGEWLRTQTNKQHRPFQEETILAYCRAAAALSAWMEEVGLEADFTGCDTAVLNRFFRSHHGSHSQGGTNTKQRNLRHLFTWLAAAYGHPHPYTDALVRYAPVQGRPSTLSGDFIRDLLEVTGGGKARDFWRARDHAMIRVLTEGVRRAELVQMRLADLPVDLIATPYVRVVPLKGARAEDEGRIVPLTPEAARAIVAYLRARRGHAKADLSPALWLGTRNRGREGRAGLALVNDASKVVAAFADADLDETAASTLALLALVARQDVEPAEGSDGRDGRWRIARKVAEDRVISAIDPEARHTRKSSSSRRDGYRAHVAAGPETGIITGERLTMASGDENTDAAVAAGLLAAEGPAGQDGPLAWYGDSAYGTGELRAAIASAGHQAVIKPRPLLPAVPGGFTGDFAIDAAAGSVTCPAGITRQVTARNAVIFGAACRDCPLRQRCTTAKDGRTLHLHEHDSLLRAARAAWPGLREDYKAHRPNVERAIAQVATRRGLRVKLRYRGTAPNDAWLKYRTAALNLRNLIGRGLTRHNGTWTLAT